MSLNKTKIVEIISDRKFWLSKSDVNEVVVAVIETLKRALENGEPVMLKGIGRFEPTIRQSRNGVNPHTLESLVIPEKKNIKFKLSGNLRNKLNAK